MVFSFWPVEGRLLLAELLRLAGRTGEAITEFEAYTKDPRAAPERVAKTCLASPNPSTKPANGTGSSTSPSRSKRGRPASCPVSVSFAPPPSHALTDSLSRNVSCG